MQAGRDPIQLKLCLRPRGLFCQTGSPLMGNQCLLQGHLTQTSSWDETSNS